MSDDNSQPPTPMMTYILAGGIALSAAGSSGSFMTLRDIQDKGGGDIVIAEMRGRLDGRMSALEQRTQSVEDTLEMRMGSIEASMVRMESRKQRGEDRLAGMITALDGRLQKMGTIIVDKLGPVNMAPKP